MRDREYSTYLLLNAPGFGTKALQYIYDALAKQNLTINDIFDRDFTSLKAILPELGQGKYMRASLNALSTLDDDKLYTAYQKLKQENVHIFGLDDNRYPQSVKTCLQEDAPPVLFCKGNLKLLDQPSLSIVGSRDVNDYALLLTRRIANRLAQNGFNVTSGLAKGVDTNAHIGALEAGGTTTMILSYGFNYLTVKKEIKTQNWEGNTLFISQFMPYEKFSGSNAMTRNKLVCALSKAVIVVCSGPERDMSGKMSGTFDAGLTAIKHNLPLFVLNPELLKPNAPQGNVDLIQRGGIPLSNGSELIDFLKKIEPNYSSRIDSNYPEIVNESEVSYEGQNTRELKVSVVNLVTVKPLTANEIIKNLNLDWTAKKMNVLLKNMDELETVKKGRSTFYKIRTSSQIEQTSLPF